MRTNIAKVKKKLYEIFQGCFDVGRREITTLDGRSAIVMFIDGLVNKETIQNDVIRPLLGFSFDSQIRPSADNLNELKAALLSPVDVRMQKDFDYGVPERGYGTVCRRHGGQPCNTDARMEFPRNFLAGDGADSARTERRLYGNYAL